MLPQGMVVLPFQNISTLVYFWKAGSQASNRWVALAWTLMAALAGLDVYAYLLNPYTGTIPWIAYSLAHLRILLLPLYMLLTALAVVARCRWWRKGDRLDEFLVTRLEGHEILPMLWAPAAIGVVSSYALGFLAHLALVGQWNSIFNENIGRGGWFQTANPGNVLLAILEFLLALLLMRAAITCSFFGAIKSVSSAGITFRAILHALQYILLAISGSAIYLFVLLAISVVALSSGIPGMTWLVVVLASSAVMSLLRHLTVDSLEDYHEFVHEWRRWLSNSAEANKKK